MFEYSIETLISKEQISEKIKELATLIKNDLKENENKEIIFVGLLRGSTIFLSEEDILGKNVIIVEDIIDTGHTLKKVKEMLELRNPKSIKICTLLDKPERREVDIHVDYTGFKIPDEFVVGYGIDYAQKHRTLPYVGIVKKI